MAKRANGRARTRRAGAIDVVEGTPIERSSGNVFADIRLPNPEEYLIKAELVRRINQLIAGKTQAQAADMLGVDQPKISALHRGRLRDFSIERLLRFLVRLGQDVDIRVRPSRRDARAPVSGRLRVLARAS